MKILVLSDLHLEFQPFMVPEQDDEANTIVILAGDIGVAKKPHTYDYFIHDLAKRFRAVLWVMGNHEHYKYNMPSTHAKLFMATVDYDNVLVLEKDTVEFDDVVFVCATLWTDMDNNNPVTTYQAGLVMNDYKYIRIGPEDEPWKRKLKVTDTIAEHLRTKEFIFSEIERNKNNGKKVVVVTHHLPSFLSIDESHKGDSLNGAYATELGEYIVEAEPEIWIHGHTHSSADYTLGETRIICNPRGYCPDYPNSEFNDKMIIEI